MADSEKDYSLRAITSHALFLALGAAIFYFAGSFMLECYKFDNTRELLERRFDRQEILQKQRLEQQELSALRRERGRECKVAAREMKKELAVLKQKKRKQR